MMRALACLLCVAILSVQGCNVIAGVATVLAPPELVPARYKLPDKRTLIVIDDPNGLIQGRSFASQIATTARTALETEQVVTAGFVEEGELAAYRAELGSAYNDVSLAGLALKFEARQVIHAEVTGYQMNIGGSLVRPAVAMNVKVFDIDKPGRVFPSETDAETGVDAGQAVYPLMVRTSGRDLSNLESARAQVQRELAEKAGRDLGRLFFDWRKPVPGSNLEKK